MKITELPPTEFDAPGGEEHIATQRWELERWEGEDPSGLSERWARKGKFSVNGSRSCAELAIVDHLRRDGWNGVWVSAFKPQELRSEWFPAQPLQTLAEALAPVWAEEAFERLVAANNGFFDGFFDVFAWREPGEIRFLEAKVVGRRRDDIRETQRRFVQMALGLGYPPGAFTIVKVPA